VPHLCLQSLTSAVASLTVGVASLTAGITFLPVGVAALPVGVSCGNRPWGSARYRRFCYLFLALPRFRGAAPGPG